MQIVYHRLAEDYSSVAAWLQALRADLLTQLAATHLAALPATAGPAEIALALAADLAGVAAPRVLLYLDELDRVPQDGHWRTFLEALVAALPAPVQLAVNARRLVHEPWADLLNAGVVAVLGTAHRRSSLIFTPVAPPMPRLEVYAFGRGHVLMNGRTVQYWDGALPRNLFFFFIDHERVTRDEIFAVFWPTLRIKEATNVFHVTKRKIAERLEEQMEMAGTCDLTIYSGGFYRPGNGMIRYYDVEDFTVALQQAAHAVNDAEQERLYRHAIAIYRAPFLHTLDMPWVVERRDKLRQMFIDALIDLGRLKKRQQHWETALGHFVRVLKEDPRREDIYREVLQMYASLGRIDDMVAQYHLLEQYLATYVGVPPSRETRDLFERLKVV
ncbi:MAG: bacterial transcriptional activator domain-containing protein [Anaerolineae bacterium]|nr:bacterial transcriptional activator domain-containing protein [Anaerolineae bacterium]